MFSDKKCVTVLAISLNNIRNAFSWLFYSGLGIYMFVFFSALSHKNQMFGSGYELTYADIFTECFSGYFVYLFFLPVGLFIRQRITRSSENVQLYLRYGNRASIWKNNVLYSAVVSFIYSLIIVAAVYISALLLCREEINWSSPFSVYYLSCGEVNERINFAEIVLISYMYTFITMLSVNIAMNIFEIYSRFGGWLAVIAYIGLNLRGPLAYCRYNIDYLSYMNIKAFLLLQLVKVIFIAAAYFAGKILIRRKEFYD